jgi:hypothetical protein
LIAPAMPTATPKNIKIGPTNLNYLAFRLLSAISFLSLVYKCFGIKHGYLSAPI